MALWQRVIFYTEVGDEVGFITSGQEYLVPDSNRRRIIGRDKHRASTVIIPGGIDTLSHPGAGGLEDCRVIVTWTKVEEPQ